MWELRIVFAQAYDDGWVWNESFRQKDVYVQESEDPVAVFKQECAAFYGEGFLNQCEIVDDGDVIELQLNDYGFSQKPVFAMIRKE